MERLDNYAIALCIYFMAGNVLDVSKTAFPGISEDLNAYFFGLQSKLSTSKTELFDVKDVLGLYCRIPLERDRQKELQELLTNYVDELEKDNLKSNDNILSWQNELKAFVKKAKTSEYNLKSYNVSIEDMHVTLYGIIQNLFTLNRIEIGLYDGDIIPTFLIRDTSGDVIGEDVSKFYDSLQIRCNVDISSFINKQENKKNNYNISGKTLLLYKKIRNFTNGYDSEIPLENFIGEKEDGNPYQSENSLKQAIYRINNYYKATYSTTTPFISKIRNGQTRFSCKITYAPNDNDTK